MRVYIVRNGATVEQMEFLKDIKAPPRVNISTSQNYTGLLCRMVFSVSDRETAVEYLERIEGTGKSIVEFGIKETVAERYHRKSAGVIEDFVLRLHAKDLSEDEVVKIVGEEYRAIVRAEYSWV